MVQKIKILVCKILGDFKEYDGLWNIGRNRKSNCGISIRDKESHSAGYSS